eukprot:scaffold20319_cov101-Isochrysis_galbana.AAC.3
MIVPWGAVGPTTAVGVYKPPHAPERAVRVRETLRVQKAAENPYEARHAAHTNFLRLWRGKSVMYPPASPGPHRRPKSVQGRVACFAPDKAYP